MRVLVLAAAVLLSGAALLWVGRGAAGESAAAEIPVLTVDPADPESSSDGVVAAATEGDVDQVSGDPSFAGGGRAAAASGAPFTGRSKNAVAQLILRAPAELVSGLATGVPEVILLRSRDNLSGVKSFGKKTTPGNGSKQRWRWRRAVEHGTVIRGVPPWKAVEAPGEVAPASKLAGIDLSKIKGDEVREALVANLGEIGAPLEIRMTIPRPGRMDRVFAEIEGQVSVGRLIGKEVVIDFRDRHERTVNVLVSHADGSPASGVPLVIGDRGSLGDLRTDGDALSDLPSTDSEGRANIMAPSGRSPSAILLGLPPVRRKGYSGEGIVLPPSGLIEVEYEGDERLRGLFNDKVFMSIRPASPAAFTFDGEWSVKTRLQERRATLHAALGQSFRLEVRTGLGMAVAEVDGPTEPGQVVHVKLSSSILPRLRFTALDDEGKPLASRQLRLRPGEIGRGFEFRDEWRAKTDEEGEVTFFLRGITSDTVLGEVHLTVDPFFDGRVRRQLVSTRDIHEPFEDGKLDLGTWTLRRVPHLVSGRVVDGGGAPVVGATVRVVSRRNIKNAWEGPNSVGFCHGQSRRDGSFDISWDRDRSQDSARELCLSSSKGASKAFEMVSFTPGDKEVVLVVEEPAGLRVDLRNLAAEGKQGLRLRLISEEPGAEGAKADELRLGELLEVKHKRPGRYAVRLEYPPESIVLVGNVQLKAGEQLVDPRLNPLSLGTAVQRRSIFVRGAGGAPVPSITIGRVRAGRADRSTRIDLDRGAFDVLAYLETPPDSYWIEADGYRRATVDVLRPGMSIELQAAMAVTVQLTGADLPGQPFAMGATWQPGNSTGRRQIRVLFDSQGRGTFEAPQPGNYELNSLTAARRRMASPMATKPWWGTTFTVPEGGGEVEVAAGG